jgi:hypothetical protein
MKKVKGNSTLGNVFEGLISKVETLLIQTHDLMTNMEKHKGIESCDCPIAQEYRRWKKTREFCKAKVEFI